MQNHFKFILTCYKQNRYAWSITNMYNKIFYMGGWKSKISHSNFLRSLPESSSGGRSGLQIAQAVTGQKQSQKESAPPMAAGLELRARGIILLCMFTLRAPSFPQITPSMWKGGREERNFEVANSYQILKPIQVNLFISAANIHVILQEQYQVFAGDYLKSVMCPHCSPNYRWITQMTIFKNITLNQRGIANTVSSLLGLWGEWLSYTSN